MHWWCLELYFAIQCSVSVSDTSGLDAGGVDNVLEEERVLVTSTGTVGTRCADGFNGFAPKQILVLGAPDELAGRVADRIGEFEGARQPTHLAQPVCEIPFCFRPPRAPGLFASHPGEPPALLCREFVPIRVSVPWPISVERPRS